MQIFIDILFFSIKYLASLPLKFPEHSFVYLFLLFSVSSFHTAFQYSNNLCQHPNVNDADFTIKEAQ